MSDSGAIEAAETPTEAARPPRRMKWRRLEDILSVRRALAEVARRAFDGDIEPPAANACTNALSHLAELIYDADIERRLRDVEDRLRGSAS